MKLKPEQIDFYAAQGYLPYGRLLDDNELELLRQEYDLEFQRAIEAQTCRDLGQDKKPGDQSPRRTLLQITQMSERNIHFRRLLYKTELLDILESLLGPNILLFEDQALWKPAFHGSRVFWHQDNAYWQCTPANLVSCWLTLDDVERDNGAMQVVPGSHLRETSHAAAGSQDVLLESAVSPEDEARAVVLDLPAGGCMFHHCRTLHCTAPNTTPRQRRAFAMHFMVPGTRGIDFSRVPEGEPVEVFRIGFHHPALRMRI